MEREGERERDRGREREGERERGREREREREGEGERGSKRGPCSTLVPWEALLCDSRKYLSELRLSLLK